MLSLLPRPLSLTRFPLLVKTAQPLSRALPRLQISQTTRNQFAIRKMTSASAPLQEWLVIAPDFDGALQKRLSVRQEHLQGLGKDPETFWLWGGAMLDEPLKDGEAPKMKGSAMLIGAKTREEVVERLKNDVYVKGEVWDWSKVQIIPFKSALRKAL
ncbi:hypothetical protein BCR34DRAFT_566097 [Clohesyomyces aquaticus]|uniref:YCII-related domain-containing protein n=1 Tax=Clohesyomyces aquaticus TaxID=1231657 RepID=A0A1Y1ZKR9_9PLEO|nr:hypothetical protein BCR34DRAFT_566097 [Clohesyomyces aquaticus]